MKGTEGIEHVRGLGSQIGFDVKDYQTNVKVLNYLKHNGVAITGTGEKTIGMNPALIFDTKHADEFMEVLRKALKSYE